ncbi:endonuclease/exonuclease/phosphatase family protein [Luteolibacter marinus]|uniref:endonuclease/exonuclease/phosphatase family protein n=1 Tax=Luteolibacter marinus TaxID=2776705 RepID=UPI001867D673|nr:endonuclease/exonuclease/phosphatase family protein [Luteolibacter marinus]
MNFKGILAASAWLLLGGPALATIVGTFNIRYDNPGDAKEGNQWSRRAPVVASLIQFHDFDLIGTQEGFHHQMEDLVRLLPEYGCSMHGRDDGKDKGEHIGIFFKRDKYELLEDGCFWLSETPDVPSKGWDADLKRLCGWAKLKRKSDGKPVFMFGLHLDHRGNRSREESVKLVLRKIGELAGDAPVFLVGDFNTDQTTAGYKTVMASGRFDDPYETARIRYALNGTPNRFDANAKTSNRIDHAFVPKGMPVKRYGVLTDSYRVPKGEKPEESQSRNFPKEVKFEDHVAHLPSDHFPVLAETID